MAKTRMPFRKEHLADERICPVCGKTNTMGSMIDDTGCQAQASNTGECHDCGHDWTDVYVLSNVILREE